MVGRDLDVMKSHKNIYADFSGGTALTKSMAMWKEMFAPMSVAYAQRQQTLFRLRRIPFFPDQDN